MNGNMASDKKQLTKEKKDIEPAISHTVDAIKTIVHCSRDEDFRRRCFATFQVDDFNDFSQALSEEFRTIARRRYGGLCDLLQEKELNVNKNNNVNMEKGNCNFDDLELLEEGSLYEVPTTSNGKKSPTDSQSTFPNAHVTHDCDKATENQDLLFDFSSGSDRNTNKAESRKARSGQNETTINMAVRGTTVLQPEQNFPKQPVPLISLSTSIDKQLLKESNFMSKQTRFEMPVKNSEVTQGCETQSSRYEPPHFSKLDTEIEDDWSNYLSWDNKFWANTKGSCPSPETCSPSSNNHAEETMEHRREEDQCVPSQESLDDFESLAEIF